MGGREKEEQSEGEVKGMERTLWGGERKKSKVRER